KIEECGIFLGDYEDNKFIIKNIVQDYENQFGTENSTVRQTKNIYEEYQKKINLEYSIDYIGEWHTHPIGNAFPSRFDDKAMLFLLNQPKYSSPKELILGIVSPKEGLRVFLYQYGKRKLEEIKVNII
ncbi:MAG: Mov34/MPN/PAD-1 family protein, partial [Candidatus Odinarchaeota archaeon]